MSPIKAGSTNCFGIVTSLRAVRRAFIKSTKNSGWACIVRTLSFIYNSMGKPVEITMDKVGKINVDYDNYGDIKKVESKEGHKMALQVTQAFQNLLSIVKPAGVNLSL